MAIIGTGISGLSAGLELLRDKNIKLTFFEKSPSVGGRIATRRYGELYVNHGPQKFDDHFVALEGRATDYPKKLKEELVRLGAEFNFNDKVKSVERNGSLISDKVNDVFDYVIITSPVPQTREILRSNLLESVSYWKKILLIGVADGEVKRIELDQAFTDKYFEETDEVIKAEALKVYPDTKSLDVKKWRYSTVASGIEHYWYQASTKVILCGDAFDPMKKFNVGSAWKSGEATAKFIKESIL